MKKTLLMMIAVLLVLTSTIGAEQMGNESIRAGKVAAVARLIAGKNDGDDVGQLAVGAEYGVIPHLSVGLGYVYIDGMYPVQENGLDISVKGFLLDQDLDVYADLGSQMYFSDGVEALFTLKAGVEWQFPFGLLIAGEGGTVLEDSEFGYMFGIRAGYRF